MNGSCSRLPGADDAPENPGKWLPATSPRASPQRSLLQRLRSFPDTFWGCGLACILSASIIFSFSTALVKVIGTKVPVLEIVLARSVLSIAAGVITGRLRHVSPLFGKRESWKLLAVRGTAGSASMLCRYIALTRLPLADAVSISFLAPSLTAMAAQVFLGEHAGPRTLVGCAMSLVGVIIVTQPPMLVEALTGKALAPWTGGKVMGVAAALGGTLFTTTSFIIIRSIGLKEKPLTVSMWFHLCSFISASIPLAIGFPSFPVWPDTEAALAMVGVALTSFFAQLFMSRALQLLSAARVSAVNLLQVVYANIYGVIFFNEDVTWVEAGGSALIGFGIVQVNRDKAGGTKAAPPQSSTYSRVARSDDHEATHLELELQTTKPRLVVP